MSGKTILIILFIFIHFGSSATDPEPLNSDYHQKNMLGWFLRGGPNFGTGVITSSFGESKNLGNGFLITAGGQRYIYDFFGLGGVVGLEILDEISFIPVVLDASWYVFAGPVSPVVNLQLGMALGILPGDTGLDWGGLRVNPNFGLKYFIKDQLSVYLSAGYLLQQIKFQYFNSNTGAYMYERPAAKFYVFQAGIGFR